MYAELVSVLTVVICWLQSVSLLLPDIVWQNQNVVDSVHYNAVLRLQMPYNTVCLLCWLYTVCTV